MKNYQHIWDAYTSAWRVDEPEARQAIFEQYLAKDCRYTDPLITATGWDQLAEYMSQFRQQIPGGHFNVTYFLAHNEKSIARWQMCNGDMQVLGEGISYGEYNHVGKLTSMTGFFETPSLESPSFKKPGA